MSEKSEYIQDLKIEPFSLEWYMQFLMFATYMKHIADSHKWARIQSWIYDRMLDKYGGHHQ